MDGQDILLHKVVSLICGRVSSCGVKREFPSFESADSAVRVLNRGEVRNELEAYPCGWCHKWHIGRKMTPDELVDVLKVFITVIQDARSKEDTKDTKGT
jgi:hypothetical protein